MCNELKARVIEAQKSIIGEVITYGQMCMGESQFKAYKKVIFNLFHEKLKQDVNELFRRYGSDQGCAKFDSIDG